jgi:choline-sulfatase
MSEKNRPNIVLILTDQQSATMMHCAGNQYLRTPTLDAIADCGVRFERAYCTNPVCIPSRFSLMTGRMPSAIGMRRNEDTSTLDPIPESIKKEGLGYLVRKAGYEAVYAGKQHLPRMKAEDLGFICLDTDERDHLAETTAEYVREARDKPFLLVASFINPHDICYMAIRDFAKTEQEKKLIARGVTEVATLDKALKIPAGISREDFFANHCPPVPANFEPQENEPEAIRLFLANRPFKEKARAHYTEEQWRMHRWAYLRLTEFVDAQIGKLWRAICESPTAENTVVIFTSDHGDMDSAHRMEHKTAFYDEASRIPLIIARPTEKGRGRVNDTHLVSNGLDLVPFICDLAEAKVPADLAGRSVRPLMQQSAPTEWRTFLPLESEIGYMVMDNRYKYMRFDKGKHNEQLIDLQLDNGEMRNAIADSIHQEALEELKRQFAETFIPGKV